jgi:hypothetical protein
VKSRKRLALEESPPLAFPRGSRREQSLHQTGPGDTFMLAPGGTDPAGLVGPRSNRRAVGRVVRVVRTGARSTRRITFAAEGAKDDDLEKIDGKRDKLIEFRQEYGYARETAEEEIDRRVA